ncbi:MAG: hypothetical protein LBM59_07935 [Ruminococcus sp.]|jgi:hypothetical protein|nr:hypothetical protein [Ruminococcus sp.]
MKERMLTETELTGIVGGINPVVFGEISMSRTELAHLVCDNYQKRMGVMGEGGAPNSCKTCSLPKPSSGQSGIVYICGNALNQRPV